jgi:hypothetical protein
MEQKIFWGTSDEVRWKRSAGNVAARMGDRRGAYKVLVKRPEDTRPF